MICQKKILPWDFTKQKYIAASGTEYTICTKNPINVIIDRVSRIDESDLILSNPNNLSICHQMNGHIGSGACLASSKRIWAISERSITREYRHIEGFRLAIGYLQTFSNKPKISLFSVASPFDHFYVTLQNLEQNARQKHVLNRVPIVA